MAKCLFIHGVSYRCGTNYLHDLLVLHPDCTSGFIHESFLLEHSDLLRRYISSTTTEWNSNWLKEVGRVEAQRELARALGDALVSFCRRGSSPSKVFVTKTPSTVGLENFAEFFPLERTILLIRDGRDVVESGIRSFGWKWHEAVEQWIASATRVAQQLDEVQMPKSMLLVRYEDLVRNTADEMRRILKFVGLDASVYNFEAALSLGVRGSSELGAGGKVHWNPVPKQPTFNPIGRYKGWTSERKRCFKDLAGPVAQRFGYDLTEMDT
jgi:hypothetical protein